MYFCRYFNDLYVFDLDQFKVYLAWSFYIKLALSDYHLLLTLGMLLNGKFCFVVNLVARNKA